jgi:hypothetical protein
VCVDILSSQRYLLLFTPLRSKNDSFACAFVIGPRDLQRIRVRENQDVQSKIVNKLHTNIQYCVDYGMLDVVHSTICQGGEYQRGQTPANF